MAASAEANNESIERTVLADASTWARSDDDVKYDAVLMKEVVHHVESSTARVALFRNVLERKLRNGGKLVVATRCFSHGGVRDMSRFSLSRL